MTFLDGGGGYLVHCCTIDLEYVELASRFELCCQMYRLRVRVMFMVEKLARDNVYQLSRKSGLCIFPNLVWML